MVACYGVPALRQAGIAMAALLLAGLAAPLLHAAEHITLRNGFDLMCDHREAAGERVRLYLVPNGSPTGPTATANPLSFVEVDPSSIASTEIVLLPPPPAATPDPAPPADIPKLLARAGSAHDLDVELLASVIRAESGGNIRAVSRAGARGLMQLMPGTAAQLGVADSFRADQNIDGGTAYLNALLLRYHDNLAFALAAYNAGPAAVDRYHGIPPYRETRAYVARIIRDFNRRKAAAASANPGANPNAVRTLVAAAIPAGQ